MLLAFRTSRDFPPAVWETISQAAQQALHPGAYEVCANHGVRDVWQGVSQFAATSPTHPRDVLARNFLLAGMATGYRDRSIWQAALQTFQADLTRFEEAGYVQLVA